MLTPEQLDKIPGHLLTEGGTERLREYLAARGLSMSCLELDRERRRRGITPPR